MPFPGRVVSGRPSREWKLLPQLSSNEELFPPICVSRDGKEEPGLLPVPGNNEVALRDLWDYKEDLAFMLLVSQKERKKRAGMKKYFMK